MSCGLFAVINNNSSTDGKETAAEETETNEAPKEVVATKVCGTVKWFNVKSGYGFINRNDTKEDVFVHQTAISKNNPKKAVRSVGDGELVRKTWFILRSVFPQATTFGVSASNVNIKRIV